MEKCFETWRVGRVKAGCENLKTNERMCAGSKLGRRSLKFKERQLQQPLRGYLRRHVRKCCADDLRWQLEENGMECSKKRKGRKEGKTAGAGGAPLARYDGRELKKGSVVGGRGCDCKLGTWLPSFLAGASVIRNELTRPRAEWARNRGLRQVDYTIRICGWLYMSVIASKSGIAGNAAAPAPAYAWNVVDGDGNGGVCLTVKRSKDHRGPALRSKDAR
ncbi:hypothetical protein K438DRAFT_1774748 [Mycena galopus ATCC 62051]|nr:hypothetical protein K438DRAFT_1774748 [Mycena galopus ATCC 62051]